MTHTSGYPPENQKQIDRTRYNPKVYQVQFVSVPGTLSPGRYRFPVKRASRLVSVREPMQEFSRIANEPGGSFYLGKVIFTLVIIIAVFSQSHLTAADSKTEKQIAAKAVKILDQYHAESPAPDGRKLHIICWRPTDRDYAENYRERLQRIIEHIQNFYADEMENYGFGRRTFQLDYDETGHLVIHEAIGDSPFFDYTKPEGERVKNDCWPVLKEAGINPDRETVLIFTNLSDWDPENLTFAHKSPYYARGSSLAGVAWQLDSPELDTENIKLKEPIIHDGEYGKISLGKHNSIFIGGIAHELGHALGLPHCTESSYHTKTALMGMGNRTYGDEIRDEGTGSFITIAHALRLASHPQFSGSVKGLYLPVKAEFSDMSATKVKKHFTIAGKVTAPVPVYAVLAYLDPDGRDDYDSRTTACVPDENGIFSLSCRELVAGKSAQIRLVACMANGSVTTWQSSYRVNENGNAKIEALQTVLDLDDFVSAINSDNRKSAREIRDQFPTGSRNRKICSAILSSKAKERVTVGAKDIPEKIKRFPLSRIAPASETVGWWRPAYNHIPRESLLLVSAGKVFTTGIYAHAESSHTYDISEGNWTSLKGSCGLPPMRSGSVVFSIKADDEEVYRSETVRPNETVDYQIDLTGISKLELLTEDAGDGKASDWAMWFDPQLHR